MPSASCCLGSCSKPMGRATPKSGCSGWGRISSVPQSRDRGRLTRAEPTRLKSVKSCNPGNPYSVYVLYQGSSDAAPSECWTGSVPGLEAGSGKEKEQGSNKLATCLQQPCNYGDAPALLRCCSDGVREAPGHVDRVSATALRIMTSPKQYLRGSGGVLGCAEESAERSEGAWRI
jgi:hypothetical protein